MLLQIRASWSMGFGMQLPPEFGEAYRAQSKSKAGPEFVNEAATDIFFYRDKLQRLFDGLKGKDVLGGPVAGRFYLWALTQYVQSVTGAPLNGPLPENAFPQSSSGPGFEEWRRDFDKAGTAQFFLSQTESRRFMMDDFKRFDERRDSHAYTTNFANQATDQLFVQIEKIRESLAAIDKQQILKQPYEFSSRVHVFWILLLSVLAFLIGVVVPLFLLVWQVRANATAESALCAAVLALMIGPLILFARDLRKPVTGNYLAVRWYVPLLKTLDSQNTKVEHAGELDTRMFHEAQSSPDFKGFSPAIRAALRSYLDAADIYNASADELNQKIMSRIRSDSRLTPALVGAPEFRGGTSLYPSEITNALRLDVISNGLAGSPHWDLSIETDMPFWFHVELVIRSEKFHASAADLVAVLREIGLSISAGPEEQKYLVAKQELAKTAGLLEAALKAEQ
jgi:hypothetical protein